MDHYLAYEELLRSGVIERLREKIMQSTPPEFLDAADVPASLRDIIEAETALELIGPAVLPQKSSIELAGVKAIFDKGYALAKQGEYGGAIHAFEEVDRKHRQTDDFVVKFLAVTALLNKGVLLRRQGRQTEAHAAEDEALRRVAEVRQDTARMRTALDLLYQGLASAEEQRYEDAVGSFDEVIRRFPDAREKRLRCLTTLAGEAKATALHRQSLFREAIEAVRRVLDSKPERCDVALRLAALFEQEGESEEPLKLFAEILARPEVIERDVGGTAERLISLAARGCTSNILSLLRESPSAGLLEPLVVGLRLYLGEDVKAAAEIMEVAKDVVKRIEERREQLAKTPATKEGRKKRK